MANYKKVCWYCESRDIEKFEDYVKCRFCGATWNYVGALGTSPVTEVDFKTGGSPSTGRPTRYKARGANKRKTKALEN